MDMLWMSRMGRSDGLEVTDEGHEGKREGGPVSSRGDALALRSRSRPIGQLLFHLLSPMTRDEVNILRS